MIKYKANNKQNKKGGENSISVLNFSQGKKKKKVFTDWVVLKKTNCFWTEVLVFGGATLCLEKSSNPPLRTVTEVGEQVLPLGE